MRYEYSEELITSSQRIGQDLNKIFSNLLNQGLKIEGQPVILPTDVDLEIKAKFKVTPEDDSFSLEISWDKPVAEEIAEDD